MFHTPTDYLLWGIVVHLICDWIFQNHYLATYKTNLRHPASWIHGGIHLVGLLLVFPWPVAIAIALIHMLIDTRVPLTWWRKFYKQTDDYSTPASTCVSLSVAFWCDQVLHIMVIALAALLVGNLYK